MLFLINLANWSYPLKDGLYAIQTYMGDAIVVSSLLESFLPSPIIDINRKFDCLRFFPPGLPSQPPLETERYCWNIVFSQIYRAFLVWERNWWVVVVPCLSWLVTFGERFNLHVVCYNLSFSSLPSSSCLLHQLPPTLFARI